MIMHRANAANFEVQNRAQASGGTSADAIYQTVAKVVRRRRPDTAAPASVLLDIGCGTGALFGHLAKACSSYIGVDVVRYPEWPTGIEFRTADLDAPRWPIDDATADVTVSVETIEHLENPRAFFRELTRITKPGGLIVVTTPNQLSLLSKLTLLLKNQFNAFQERPGLYPAHLTALLEIDLVRISRECGLNNIEVEYTNHGRIPGTRASWPYAMRCRGRAFSDNVVLSAWR